MKNISTIYIDMDGVLVDFNKGYLDLTGIDLSNSYRNDEEFWEPIDKAGYSFWIGLPWKKDGKKLWSYIKKYKPILLSAPSRRDESRVGKMDWVKKELPNTRLILRSAKNKKEFANENSILIDDRPENIQGWIDAGGIGVLHDTTEKTLKELKKLGL